MEIKKSSSSRIIDVCAAKLHIVLLSECLDIFSIWEFLQSSKIGVCFEPQQYLS